MISDEVQRFAEIHELTITKAMDEFFKIYPEKYSIHKAEVNDSANNKKQSSSEDRKREREYVDTLMEHEIYMVARRDNLDLEKPADKATATERAATENSALYKRVREVNSVRVGITPLDPVTDG
jgi:hypothetical protein